MDKRFVGILAALVIIFVGIFAFSQKSSNSTNTNNNAKGTNHVTGNTSGVTLVEYGDYECPVCFNYYQPLKDAAAQLKDKAAFQFKNLPLAQIHPNAYAAARAAEAAGMQNKFWEMHDLLYQNQDPSAQAGWVTSKSALEDYFVKYAEQLNLNLPQFRQDYASSSVNDVINSDISEFGKTGQQKATPTFFLNGKYVENSKLTDDRGQVSVDKIVALVNDALAKKSQ